MKVLTAVENGALAGAFQALGLEVVELQSSADVVAQKGGDPSFALIDEALPEALSLIVNIKAQIDGPDRDRLPILTLGNPKAPTTRCVPDRHFEEEDAETILKAARTIILQRARQRRLFDQEAVLKVPTTPDEVERAGEMIDLLVGAVGYSEEDSVKLGTTLREAVGNAAEHGNDNDPQRKIHINFLRSNDRLTFVVSDEGKGFDTENFLKRADEVSALEHTRSRRENEARPGGLGVFIMRQTCDSIDFNSAGNVIYLTKYLPGHEPQA